MTLNEKMTRLVAAVDKSRIAYTVSVKETCAVEVTLSQARANENAALNELTAARQQVNKFHPFME